ncbi:MAG TPA: outer membrane protein [Pseudolabrys sp.]|jgi:outer membrane immunogenic protein|nr:outer membrane protein [Pseudolabrys sp.]
MKRLISAGVAALVAMTMMAAANAADILRRETMPMGAPAYYVPYNWTGFYVGINGGGGWGSSDWSANSIDVSGGLVGGTLGYNWQLGQGVYGLEGDIDWSNIGGSTACGVTSCETHNDWLGTVRARFGYSFDRFMPYITGGLAFGGVQSNVAGFLNNSDSKVGWTIGAGVEGVLAGPWTAKIEYLYVDLGNNANIDFRANLVRAGVNYRF